MAEAINRMATIDLYLAERAAPGRCPTSWPGSGGLRRAWRGRASRATSTSPAPSTNPSRLLAIREKAFGPDHPAVASGLAGLAAVHVARGQYAQAEPLLKRALAISEKTLGPDHPATASILDDYADALSNARKDAASLAQAKAMKIRARAILDAQVQRASADAPPTIAPVR